MTKKRRAVIGLVKTRDQADAMVHDLKSGGFADDDISVLLPDARSSRDVAFTTGSKAPEGSITGVAAGGAVGGAIGLLAGIGALAIPGLGPFIAAGPILAAFTGAAAGGAVGGITGALIGMGIPEIEAKQYDGKVRAGAIFLSVHVEDDDEHRLATKILKLDGAKEVTTLHEARA